MSLGKEVFFSVIIPTYNQSEFLESCIHSVLDQTFIDFEIIVIDNFSTDETLRILESISDSRLIFYRYANQGSIASSRNYGAKKAKGIFLAFLDSDDMWLPNKLETVFNALTDGIGVICHSEIWFQEGKYERIVHWTLMEV